MDSVFIERSLLSVKNEIFYKLKCFEIHKVLTLSFLFYSKNGLTSAQPQTSPQLSFKHHLCSASNISSAQLHPSFLLTPKATRSKALSLQCPEFLATHSNIWQMQNPFFSVFMHKTFFLSLRKSNAFQKCSVHCIKMIYWNCKDRETRKKILKCTSDSF
jgi:hypothetical protein